MNNPTATNKPILEHARTWNLRNVSVKTTYRARYASPECV